VPEDDVLNIIFPSWSLLNIALFRDKNMVKRLREFCVSDEMRTVAIKKFTILENFLELSLFFAVLASEAPKVKVSGKTRFYSNSSRVKYSQTTMNLQSSHHLETNFFFEHSYQTTVTPSRY
jgi:hypothetical protein